VSNLRRFLRLGLALGSTLGAASALAQSGPTARSLNVVGSPPLAESVAPTQVSGALSRRAVYGLLVGKTTELLPYPRRGSGHPAVWVDAMGPNDRVLCIELARAQGGYEARFTIAVPPGDSPIRVPFDSSSAARQLFESLPPTAAELVARVRPAKGRDCNDTQPLLPAAMVDRGAVLEPLHLAVGGAGKGLPVVRLNGEPQRECQAIGRLLGRADFGANVFGYLCPIAAQIPGACQPENIVRVTWLEGNTASDEVDIPFRRRCYGSR
jgi:hypothetical protein